MSDRTRSRIFVAVLTAIVGGIIACAVINFEATGLALLSVFGLFFIVACFGKWIKAGKGTTPEAVRMMRATQEAARAAEEFRREELIGEDTIGRTILPVPARHRLAAPARSNPLVDAVESDPDEATPTLRELRELQMQPSWEDGWTTSYRTADISARLAKMDKTDGDDTEQIWPVAA